MTQLSWYKTNIHCQLVLFLLAKFHCYVKLNIVHNFG